MSQELKFKGVVRGIVADEKKVEVKMLIDPSDLSAHEDLLKLRGIEIDVSISISGQGGGYE